MGWQSTPLSGSRISGSRCGRSWNATAGASNASSRASASKFSAAASRRPCVQRGRCDGAISSDLAGYQPQPAAVEGAAERSRHRRIAVPAQFEHGCLLAGEREGRAESGRVAAGVNDEVAIALCRFGRRKANTELLALIPRARG